MSISCKTEGMMGDMKWDVDEVHLKDYDISKLPDSPICPFLVKLFLQVPTLTVISPTFFEHMPMLEVLDLSNTNIVSLPASISNLSSLQEFFLKDCPALMELPTHIGMLSNLKLFDIRGTELLIIPKEMGKLTKLEHLRVSLSQYAKYYIKDVQTNSDQQTVFPRNMISALNQLKELCVIISVGSEPEWWEEEVKDLQNELCDLENLQTLNWYLPTHEVVQHFLLLKRNDKPIYKTLSNMVLTIGQHAQLTSCLPHGLEKKFQEFSNCLNWINAEGSEADISKIIASVEALFLHRHWTIVNLSTFSLTNLKYCLLAECYEMETLVEAPKDVEKVGLEMLEYLSIHHMHNLRSIWKGLIGNDSLSKLTILALHSCPKLTSVFTLSIAKNLLCLTELTVNDCPKVRNLISTESYNVKHGLIFPTLDRIFLLDLPELVNIFESPFILDTLSTLLIYNCLKLDLSITKLPQIKTIKCENRWWDKLDCDTYWRKEDIFEPLKERRDLVEQLLEATNSLQHFHDRISHGSSAEGEASPASAQSSQDRTNQDGTSSSRSKAVEAPVRQSKPKPETKYSPNNKGTQRPSYPSSRPTKDWDKLEAQVKKEEKDEKLDGDAALNKFFRDIYKDADDDKRRAMRKSFVESSGTVLSTNWKEVGSKEVEGTPPDGMEMKKWEY